MRTHASGTSSRLEERLAYAEVGSTPASRTMGLNRFRRTNGGPCSEPGEADDLRQIPVGKSTNANIDIECSQELAVA